MYNIIRTSQSNEALPTSILTGLYTIALPFPLHPSSPSPSLLSPVPRFLSLLVNSKWRFLYKPFFSFPRRYRLISRPIYTFKVLIRRWLANVSRPISPARRLLVSIFEAVPCNSGGRPGSLSDGRARGIERAPALLPPLRCSCHQARKIRFDMIRCDPREASHARVCLLWNTVSRLRFLFPSSSPCPSVPKSIRGSEYSNQNTIINGNSPSLSKCSSTITHSFTTGNHNTEE